MFATALPAVRQTPVLAPVAEPSSALGVLGPALLVLYVAVVAGVARLLVPGDGTSTRSAPRFLAVSVASLVVGVVAVGVPVVALGVPRTAVGVPATPPTPVTVVVLGAFGGVVLHYLAGMCKPFVHAPLPDPAASDLPDAPAVGRRVTVAATVLAAIRDAVLACAAVAAVVAAYGVPPVVVAAVAVVVRGLSDVALTPTPAVKVADRLLAEVGVLGAFLLTESLLLAVAVHAGYALYTQFQIQRYVVERYDPGAGA